MYRFVNQQLGDSSVVAAARPLSQHRSTDTCYTIDDLLAAWRPS